MNKCALAAISLNFDSLRTIIGHQYLDKSTGFDFSSDPCYFSVLDRFLYFADKFNFKFSAYLIGKDLECPKLANQARLLFDSGHELGNHSYSHITNLGQMPRSVIESEIVDAHRLIAEVSRGAQPKGFVAPSWALSPDILDILRANNYSYDCSLFPSFIMPLLQFKLSRWSSSTNTGNDFPIFRRDLIGNLLGSSKPYMANKLNPWGLRRSSEGIVCLPLPTIYTRIAFWHSWAFKVSDKTYAHWVRRAVKSTPFFYLVTHPADLIDPDRDLRGLPSSLLKFERMAVPLKYKLEKMKIALDIISEARSIVRMDELAESAKSSLGQL